MTPNRPPAFKNIAVAAHPQVAEALREAEQVAVYLNAHDIQAVHGILYDDILRRSVQAGEFDLLIALGGDGTMLRAGHLCAPAGVPILGINLGRFGFLMEVQQNQWREFLPRLLVGDYWLERRMMLAVEHWRGDSRLGVWDALNEVIVSRGQVVRPVHLCAYLDGRFLTTYVADGLIAATPTGSTAYALAAGGPILPPELRNILLVPVAPHLSIDRAIILSEGASVSITVEADHHAVLCIDGQTPVDFDNADRVDVRAGPHTAQFIRFQDPGYFYRNLTPHMSQNPSTSNHR